MPKKNGCKCTCVAAAAQDRQSIEAATQAISPPSLHPTPNNLHPTFYNHPYTLHPPPYTLHPTPYTLHSTPYTLHPTSYILQPTAYTLKLYSLRQNPDPEALKSVSHRTCSMIYGTLNLKPSNP